MAKKQKLDPNWESKPAWRKTVEKVKKAEAAGLAIDQIIAVTALEPTVVRRIVEDERITEAQARENFKYKLPLVKEILGMGIEVIHQIVSEIVLDQSSRREFIPNAQAAKAFTAALADLNTLIRLEEGKATEISASVQFNFQNTRAAFQDLKKSDPVFGDMYPELPEPKPEA